MAYNMYKRIIRFSSFQFMFNIINYFSRNLDNILIGKFLGPAELGCYDKSYRLMTLPVQNLTHVITPVLMPVLSKYQDDKSTIYNTYLKVVNLLAVIGFPLSIFLYFAAPEIINVVYGPQWVQSIPVFKILALTIGIQMILSSYGAIFQAVNRTDLLFYSGFLSAAFMVGGIAYGVFINKTLVSVGYGLLVAFVINFFQGYFMLIQIALKHSFFKFLKILIHPVLISISMGLSLYIISFWLVEKNIYSLFIKMVVAFLSFVLVLLFKEQYRILLKKIALKVFRKTNT
jgi:teichuronic acid exporter